jgi:hypothetical protein
LGGGAVGGDVEGGGGGEGEGDAGGSEGEAFDFGEGHHVVGSFDEEGDGGVGGGGVVEDGLEEGGGEVRGGVDRGEGGEGGGGEGGGEAALEACEGAGEAFLGGGFGEAEGLGDFVDGAVFEVAEGEEGAVGEGETGEGAIEVAGEVFVGGWDGGLGFVSHEGGLPFVMEAALRAAARIQDAVVGGFEKPAAEGGVGAEVGGVFGDEDEDGLGDVFGEGGVADLAECGGVDEVEVALDEGGEGGVAARGEVVGE